jgi:hypothetical protein
MIWILLFYVLPIVIGVIGAYFMTKQDGGSMRDFLEVLPWLLIPLLNILYVLAGLYVIMAKWIKDGESIQNFLNKKL